jgi:hypothetical protein
MKRPYRNKMNPAKLNYLAIFTAAVSAFLIGGLWYSPVLFGKAWMKASGLDETAMQKRKMGMVFTAALLLALVISFNLAAFLQGPPNLTWGIAAGALAGIGWVATAMGVTYLFEARPLKLFFIDAGYHAVSFMVMGGILGAWK